MGFLSPTTIELADSAVRKLRAGEAVTAPDAARKAVAGRGITNQADRDRRAKEVLRELQRRSAAARKAKRLASQVAEKIAERAN